MDQNVDFSSDDQIQNPQYPDVQENSLTNDEFEAYTNANDANMNDLQFKLYNFQKNQQDFQEKFEQMHDDFQNRIRNFMQNFLDGLLIPPPAEDKEYEATMDTELPSTEDIQPLPVQEPPQEFDIRQLIREQCCVEVPEEQKQSLEDTMLDALNSNLLLINSNSQRLDKKEQEVKNVVEQPAERGNHSIQSLQNFRVVHKSSISFRNRSQISSIHAVAPILSTKEPEHLLSMGYEHLNITPEMESDEVIESNAENLLPILSKCEVTFKDEIECDMPAKDVCSLVFTTFSKSLFKDNDDLDYEINSDKLDPYCFNVEYDFVESLLNRDTFIDFSSKFDFSGELAHIKPEIPKSDFDFEEEIRLFEKLLYDNSSPRSPKELNAEIADTILESIPSLHILVWDGDSQQEEIDIVTETDDVLPPSVENDDDYDPLLEEVDLFLSNNSIPQGIENVADDPEGDVRFLEELLINDFILSHESSDSNFEDNPSIPRPPPEPPDVETDAGEAIPVVMNEKDKDVDYSYSVFVIFDKMFSLLFVESEDTIFDPGISD
uniref:Reverse transcriptase domain-containing protein n=1 Tax=Tanacetum cinerariifolium TaxID=118510 RepID=A0A699K902_TANCI|nr:hypothetical protein [Tanacetum cinerariifolium]